MITIQRCKDRRGDLTLHAGGCADTTRKGNHDVETFSGPDMVAAIIAADIDAADWFCEIEYTQSSRDNGVWYASIHQHAPCFVQAMKEHGAYFDDNGYPRNIETE